MPNINPSIGGYQFIGEVAPKIVTAMEQLESLEREGIDGHEFYEVGKRAPIEQWRTFADTNDPDGLVSAYRDMSGTLQTVVNTDGSSVPKVSIALLPGTTVKRFLKSLGGLNAGAWGVTANWKLQSGM